MKIRKEWTIRPNSSVQTGFNKKTNIDTTASFFGRQTH